VGIDDRDYMRERTRPQPAPTSRIVLLGLVAAALGLGYHVLHPHSRQVAGVTVQPLVFPRTPGFSVSVPTSPYARNDPWAAWLAPDSVCPGGDDASQSVPVQVSVATCLLNYARERQALPPLARSAVLDAGSLRKAQDIVACNQFSHFACGKSPDADARADGLTDALFGENIYWGPAMYEPPRVAVDQWLNSDHHRENLFDPRWESQGVAVLVTPSFQRSQGEVWVNEFSAR
jgi:uncharacterized protein YkwD